MKIIDAVGSIARRFDFAGDPREAHAALSHVRLVQARLRVSMYQERPISIDCVQTSKISKPSRVIDRAIDTLIANCHHRHDEAERSNLE